MNPTLRCCIVSALLCLGVSELSAQAPLFRADFRDQQPRTGLRNLSVTAFPDALIFPSDRTGPETGSRLFSLIEEAGNVFLGIEQRNVELTTVFSFPEAHPAPGQTVEVRFDLRYPEGPVAGGGNLRIGLYFLPAGNLPSQPSPDPRRAGFVISTNPGEDGAATALSYDGTDTPDICGGKRLQALRSPIVRQARSVDFGRRWATIQMDFTRKQSDDGWIIDVLGGPTLRAEVLDKDLEGPFGPRAFNTLGIRPRGLPSGSMLHVDNVVVRLRD